MKPSIIVSSSSRVVRKSSVFNLHCTVRFVKSTLELFLHNHDNFRITGISKFTEVKGLQVCFQFLNKS